METPRYFWLTRKWVMRGRRGISIWKRNQNRPLLRLWTPNQMVPPCQNLRLQMTWWFIGEFSGVKFSRGFQGQKSPWVWTKNAGLILACAFSRHFLKKIKQKKPPSARALGGLIPRFSFTLAAASGPDSHRDSGPFLLRSGQRDPVISSLSLLVVMERAGSTGSRVWTIGNVLRGQSLQEVWVVVARCDGGFNRPVLCPVHNSWVPAISRRKIGGCQSRVQRMAPWRIGSAIGSHPMRAGQRKGSTGGHYPLQPLSEIVCKEEPPVSRRLCFTGGFGA